MIGTNFAARALATLGPTPWENDPVVGAAGAPGGNPWDNDEIIAPAPGQAAPRLSARPGVIRGAPKQPAPLEQDRFDLSVRAADRADAAAARIAANQERQTQLQAAANARETGQATSTAQNRTFDNVAKMRTEFSGLQQSKDFNIVLPQIASAMKIADNPNATGADDLNLIYTFGKVMDPGSVVRESELAMAGSTGSWAQNMEGAISRLRSGDRLPSDVRHNLVESMRRRGIEMAHAYNQQRGAYKDMAGRNGFNPLDVVGAHPAAPFQQAEADFTHHTIGNLDGVPSTRPTGAPPLVPPQDRGDVKFNDEMPDKASSSFRLTPEQDSAFRALIQHGGTDEQVAALMNEFHPGANIGNIDELRKFATDPRTKGLPFGETDYSRVDEIKPVDPGDGAIGAASRGVADAGSLGFLDEAGAAVDTLKGGTFDENLDRRRGMEVFDEQQHPWARTAGQVVGGVALPLGGAKTLPEIARVGAGYGATYGAGSADGGIGDRALGAAGGAVSGYAGSMAAGGVGRAAAGIGSKLAPRIGPLRRAANEALPVVEAAERQNVPITVADAMPGARPLYGNLEAVPLAGGRVNEDMRAGNAAIEKRVGEVGGPDVVDRQTLGETLRGAGNRYVERSGDAGNRAYQIAERRAAGQQITPTETLKEIDGQLVELKRAPNTNAEKISLLEKYRGDLVDPSGAPKAVDLDVLRSMNSELGSKTNTEGLRGTDIQRRAGMMMGGADRDIRAQLSGSALQAYDRADKLWKARSENIDRVVSTFIGGKGDAALSAEKIASNVPNMAGPRRGDAATLSKMMAGLKEDERSQVASTLAAELGRRGEDGTANAFSAQRFFGEVQKYSPAARKAIWGEQGAKDLADLAKLAEARAGTQGKMNNSGSGRVSNFKDTMIGILSGAGAGTAIGRPAAGAGAVAGTLLSARGLASLMGSKAAVNALAYAARANTIAKQGTAMRRLGALAAKEPAITEALMPVKEHLEKAWNEDYRRKRD